MTHPASGSGLGHATDYPDSYDAGLLFPMPREASRAALGIAAQTLPFGGVDRWHAWEISWLNPQGKPEVAIGRFDIPADSSHIVESKSLKLYLNGYNNERMSSLEAVRALIETDLSAACQSGVTVQMYAPDGVPPVPISRGCRRLAVSPMKFLADVRTEAQRVTWPTRRETLITTGLVLAMAALTAAFFFIVDQLIGIAVRSLFGLGG